MTNLALLDVFNQIWW